jgi:hypothetical protein
VRLGEALTRGAFLSDTSCAAIDAGISRTGRFHPATPVDNCALRQLRIHEYDAGSFATGSAANYVAKNRRLASATVGFWQDVYNDPLGRLVTGAEYEYIRRAAFHGIGGAPSSANNVILTSLRYYPFN